MRKFFASVIAALALAVAVAAPAQAATACTSTVAKVFTNYTYGSASTNSFYVLLTSGASFLVNSGDTNYGQVMSQATMAMFTGMTVEVRFTANGVSCSTTAWRTDMEQFNAYP